jgi:hypothetical protein
MHASGGWWVFVEGRRGDGRFNASAFRRAPSLTRQVGCQRPLF